MREGEGERERGKGESERGGRGVGGGATKRIIHSNKIKLVSLYTQDEIMVCAPMHVHMYTVVTYVHVEGNNKAARVCMVHYDEYIQYVYDAHICRPGTAASSLHEA